MELSQLKELGLITLKGMGRGATWNPNNTAIELGRIRQNQAELGRTIKNPYKTYAYIAISRFVAYTI